MTFTASYKSLNNKSKLKIQKSKNVVMDIWGKNGFKAVQNTNFIIRKNRINQNKKKYEKIRKLSNLPKSDISFNILKSVKLNEKSEPNNDTNIIDVANKQDGGGGDNDVANINKGGDKGVFDNLDDNSENGSLRVQKKIIKNGRRKTRRDINKRRRRNIQKSKSLRKDIERKKNDDLENLEKILEEINNEEKSKNKNKTKKLKFSKNGFSKNKFSKNGVNVCSSNNKPDLKFSKNGTSCLRKVKSVSTQKSLNELINGLGKNGLLSGKRH